MRAVDALGRSRQQGQGIEELVLRLLGDADLRAQDLGIYACGQLRLTYEPLIPTKGLVRLTGGPVITALCALLPASSPEREQRIIGLIGAVALDAPGLIAGIQDRLRGEDAKTWLQAVLEKIQLGIQGEQEFGIVRSCLRSEDENIRLGAFELFDSFQVDEQTRWAILIASVEDPYAAIRTGSLIDFSWGGAADRPEALAALTRRLADEDDRVRILAAGALVENGMVTDVLIDTLLDSLDSDSDRDVENAMGILRSLIPTRPDAFEAGIDRLLLLDVQNAGLNNLLSLTAAPADEEERGPVDTHLCVQSRGWEAAFDADETPSVLMRRLSSTDPRLRLGAARVFAVSGHEAAPEVAALLERCLDDRWSEVRATAALALQYHRLDAGGYELLLARLGDESPRVRHAVMETCSRLAERHIRPGAAACGDAIPQERLARTVRALQSLTVDPVPWVQAEAKRAMESLSEASRA